MKQLLIWGGTGFMITALLDPLIYWGLEKPIPWLRDVAMMASGIGCLYLLVKYRKRL